MAKMPSIENQAAAVAEKVLDDYEYKGKSIRQWVDAIVNGDAVPVVRCKDCVYWQDNNGGYPHEDCRWGKDETPDADDFCSYGERKDGDGNG